MLILVTATGGSVTVKACHDWHSKPARLSPVTSPASIRSSSVSGIVTFVSGGNRYRWVAEVSIFRVGAGVPLRFVICC